jgi:small subunit ribosomal protein S20
LLVAHSLSAEKRVRQNARHRARNRARKDLIKTHLKSFAAAVASGDVSKAKTELISTVRRLDKVAAKGTIHKNTAARKRSRLTLRLNAMGITPPLAVGDGGKAAKPAKTSKVTAKPKAAAKSR